MSWFDMFRNLLDSGSTMATINTRIKLYCKYNIISVTEKIEIYASLLHEGYFAESDLDTYITGGFITAEEKAQILALEATY